MPLYKPSKGQSSRVEYRALDSAANPYLAYALMLAAGLKGIEEEYELPPEAEDNVWSLTDGERRALGYAPLPASLDHALWYHRLFRADDWLLYAQDSPSSHGARGFCRGSIFTRDGALVASVAQEGLMRQRASAFVPR